MPNDPDSQLVIDFKARMLRALCTGCSTPIYKWERFVHVWAGRESLGVYHERCAGRETT